MSLPHTRRFTSWLLTLSPVQFTVLSALAAHALRLPVAAALLRLSTAPPDALIRTDIVETIARGPVAALLTAVLLLTLVPLGETLACQWLPMRLLRPFGPVARILGSATLFGYLHIFSPGPTAVVFAAAFIPGLVFAATLLRWEQRGFWPAVLTTTLAHSLTNMIALPVLVGLTFSGL